MRGEDSRRRIDTDVNAVSTRSMTAMPSSTSSPIHAPDASAHVSRRRGSHGVARASLSALAAIVALVTALPSSAVAQRSRDTDRDRDRDDDRGQRRENGFTWNGVIEDGRRIVIRNLNGEIVVERSSNSRVDVSAEKRWRRSDPEEVRIEQRRIGDDILVCAIWRDATCDEDGIHAPRNRSSGANDVNVRFVVRVPEGVRVDVGTVNGGIEVDGVTTEVRANTVNGSIIARSAGGPVRAKTVNGSIRVSMGSLGRARDLEYQTVNGSVTLELPPNFGAELEMSTVNGHVSTDFPIMVSGTMSPRRLRGTVGNGETRVRVSTVNGSVTLKRM